MMEVVVFLFPYLGIGNGLHLGLSLPVLLPSVAPHLFPHLWSLLPVLTGTSTFADCGQVSVVTVLANLYHVCRAVV